MFENHKTFFESVFAQTNQLNKR